MTARPDLVPAMGGTRRVPAPDAIATDYLLLGLRLDQHVPGLIDGYFGPAELKARVDLEQRRSPARLRADAVELIERVAAEVTDDDRSAWLIAQLVAIEAQARSLAGDPLPYLELVERCMGFAPTAHDDAIFAAARADIDALLPGSDPVADRLAAWDRSIEVPVGRLAVAADWLIDRFRAQAAADFGLPEGEALSVSLVSGQPWSAYDWYLGGGRSRVDINTDLPIAAPRLVELVAHGAYPGHHLEHATKEAHLVDGLGRLEASILLINTPECPVSEGLAEVAPTFAAPPAERPDLLVELFARAGLAIAGDPVAARDAADLAVALAGPRDVLGAIPGEAALRRHAEGRSRGEVLDYLREVGGSSPAAAEKHLSFIEHPLWRTYVFVYDDGAALVRRWLDAAPEADRRDRFGRLLREQLTPGRLRAPSD